MWLRFDLGGVYTAMAAGQAVSWERMPTILAAYQAVFAPALPWLGGALIAAEAGCGLWLLSRPRPAALAPVRIYTAVTVVWALLGVQAQLRGLPVVNCGCVGVYLAQRLSWFVQAEDGLLGYAVLMFGAAHRVRTGQPAPERRSVSTG